MPGVIKDPQGRGWELKYAIYIKDIDPLSEDEAVEIVNRIMRQAFKNVDEVVDWDGPL